MGFKDHFSTQAKAYSQFRPTYPRALYEYLSSICVEHDCAWDCATGNGQAAVALTDYFDNVIATDASEAQINNTTTHQKIDYQVAPAERVESIPARSIDLITIAQALHWFDFDNFYKEAKRVAKPHGIIAAWTYPLLKLDDEKIQQALEHFYFDTLKPYWPPERAHCDARYKNIPFPFEQIDAPTFKEKFVWSRDQFIGYLSTWSAVQKYIKQQGESPVETQFISVIDSLWPSNEKHASELEFVLKVGRV